MKERRKCGIIDGKPFPKCPKSIRPESHVHHYRRLVREVVAGSPYGDRIMQFPSQVKMNALRDVIAREFRLVNSPVSESGRIQLAFLALKELNGSLEGAKYLEGRTNTGLDEEGIRLRNEAQAALHVSPLPWDPVECVKPGTFLVAHPFVSGYFHRTVVCILDHKDDSPETGGGTYGLVVNRVGRSPKTGKHVTLHDVLRTVPPQLSEAFGQTMIRDGGPVHMSLQMIHATTEAVTHVGGNVLSMVTDGESSTALNTDRAIYFEGDVVKAAEAVKNGMLQPSDVCFYAGASCWEARQLESEIERGFWIPCRGPPEIALTGKCDHQQSNSRDDLWLSMLSACGQEEANLAHLLVDADDVEVVPCDLVAA
ncbi:putative ACR [Fragilaria crotonensis]|nr:putative ACR [Fragilaria crotonensis]